MSWTLVRSTTSHDIDRYYVEVTVGNVAGAVMMGLIAGATSTTGYPGDATVGGNGYGNDRNFYTNGAVTGANAAALVAIDEGDVIGFDIDLDANTYAVRNVTKAEAWSAAQALHATIDEEACYVGVGLFAVDDSVTINFAGPFVGDLPSDDADAWDITPDPGGGVVIEPAEALYLGLPPKPPPPNVRLIADGLPTKTFHDYLTLQYEWERRLHAVLTE